MSTLLSSLGRWSYRHPWRVIGSWILLLLVIVAAVAAGILIYRAQHSIIKNELGLRNVQVEQSLLQTGGAFYTY